MKSTKMEIASGLSLPILFKLAAADDWVILLFELRIKSPQAEIATVLPLSIFPKHSAARHRVT